MQEERTYTEKGITFESVKIPLTLFREGPVGIIPATKGTNAEGPKGILYSTNEVLQAVPFINAVDIDWNGAKISKKIKLDTTADLLNWIKGNNVTSEVKDLLEGTPSENRSIIIYDDNLWDYEVLKLPLISVTYDELVSLRYYKKLEPGRLYRITDYVTKVKESNEYSSAEHLFDIIVTALDNSTLDENARALNHLKFGYFVNNKLSAWRLKYSLFNSSGKYDWALESGGKGVIFYMIDEFGNEAGYDFKNILFNNLYTFNYLDFDTGSDSSSESSESSPSESSSSEENTLDSELSSLENEILYINKDASLSPTCNNNIIKPLIDSIGKHYLNHNVILDASDSCDIVILENCEHITIKKGSHILIHSKNKNITFDDVCYNVFISQVINNKENVLNLNPRNKLILGEWGIIGKNLNSEIVRIRLFDMYDSLQSLRNRVSVLENFDLTPVFENNPLSLQLKNGTNDISLITLLMDSNNQITDLNNFPQTITLNINQNGLLLSDNTKVQSLTLILSGATYNLLNYADLSLAGIYLSGVTSHTTDALYTLTFAFRGGPKTVTSNSLSVHVTVLDGSTTHNFSKTIPIVPLTSIRGNDAELHLLYKYLELLEVNSSGHLQCTLRYGLMHIVGQSVEMITPTYQVLKVKFFNFNGQLIGNQETINWDSTNNYWEYTRLIQDWYSYALENQIYYAIVELQDNEGNVLENSVVNVELLSTGFLRVTNGLTESVQTLTDNYSSIVQTADNINFTVANMSRFNNGEFPENNEYLLYAYYRSASNIPPARPEGDVLVDNQLNNLWTLYKITAIEEDYRYVWYSKRTKPLNLDQWSLWSLPLLFQMWGNPRGYVNGASLQIKADEITSTVASTYETIDNVNTTKSQLQSQILLTADNIRSEVSSTYLTKDNATDTTNMLMLNISIINLAADGINLEVINMLNFANGSFPVNNEYQQYVYYCTTPGDAPSKPSGDITTDTEVYGEWTTYNIEATETYKYVWYSVRTKEIDLSLEDLSSDSEDWGDWSDSMLLQIFGSPRGYVNNAALKITADEIASTVDSTKSQLQSKIKQTADSIGLTVNKFVNGEFPENNDYLQYIYYRASSNDVPSTPEGDIETATPVNDAWTIYNLEATETYKYVWYSVRTKPLVDDNSSVEEVAWSSWENPVLIQIYGGSKRFVNGAALKITADNITSTVSETCESKTHALETASFLQSQILQTSDRILSTVSATYLTQSDASNTYETQTDAASTTASIRQDMSAIDQKADSISLHVDSVESDLNGVVTDLSTTGIDIEHGKITLTADNTDIRGSLNVYSDNTGICLYDALGNLKSLFVSRNISDISNLNFVKVNTVSIPITSETPNPVILEANLGLIESNRKLTISDLTIRFYFEGGGYEVHPFSDSITLLDANNITVTSGTINNYTIPETGIYKLRLTAQILYSRVAIVEWIFTETLTGSSYLIIGRDGLVHANTNNRLFRVDDNTITLRRQNDAIYFENGNNYTSMYRLGWNRNNEEKIPFDNFNSFIRLIDGAIDDTGHYDVVLNPDNRKHELKYGECGTVIVKIGLYLTYQTTIDLYLPSMVNRAPGYTLNIVHASINNWASQNRGEYIHKLRVHSVDNLFPIYFNGNYYDNVSEGAVLSIMWNYKCTFTGVEWILS